MQERVEVLRRTADGLSSAAAAHALANMTAFRSGSCQACSSRKVGGAGFLALPHLRPPPVRFLPHPSGAPCPVPCVHHLRHALSLADLPTCRCPACLRGRVLSCIPALSSTDTVLWACTDVGGDGVQGGGACQHRPQGLVAASSAPASLLGLMNASGHAQTVSACIATLNNLCASEEGADRVLEEAKRFAPHVSPHA